jgi:hypothetical protein
MNEAPPPDPFEPAPDPIEPGPVGSSPPSNSDSPAIRPAAYPVSPMPPSYQPYAAAGYHGAPSAYPPLGATGGYPGGAGGYPGATGGYPASRRGGYRPATPGPAGGPPLPGINRIQPVGGTPFAFAYVRVPPVTSGLAIGSLIAGIASIAVGLGMLCLGLSGASDGWGALVAGAFAILSVLLGAAGIAFSRSAARLIRRAAGATAGAGMANAGMICGWVGVALSVIGFFGTLAATLSG